MDPTEGLFPELPEDLSSVSDEDLAALLQKHEVAADLIASGNEDFMKGISPEEELSELDRGASQVEAIKEEQASREAAAEEFSRQRAEQLARFKGEELAEESPDDGDDDGGEGDGGEGDGEGAEAMAAEEEAEPLASEEGDGGDEGDGGEGDGEGESAGAPAPAVVATMAAEPAKPKRPMRRPPSPAAERMGKEQAAALIAAAGQVGIRGGAVLDRMGYVDSLLKVAKSIGTSPKHEAGILQRFLVASAEFPFPAERRLLPGEPDLNARKIRNVVPAGIPGLYGLVASGGLCAPLENIYTLVNFAVQNRPVRDALPSFQADRGGVNVPESPTIGEIDGAISLITEAMDALGGTNATKSCQDLDCVDYVETAVTVIAHCREYGNLNARAWPERIAHENDLTMAAWARTAEVYLLDRIKAQSIQVTQGAVGATMNAFASLVYAISAATAGVKRRLRMDDGTQFRAIFPAWIGEILAADDALKQFADPPDAKAALTAELSRYGVNIVYALDDPTGASTFGATQAAGALDAFPGEVQYALYPEGEFIHLDSGTLELGIVRDSTLNSTNDFQLFGESFENVARIGPAQAALWITQDICPNGVFPALGTAPTC